MVGVFCSQLPFSLANGTAWSSQRCPAQCFGLDRFMPAHTSSTPRHGITTMMGLRTPDYFDLKRDIKAHGLSHRLKACKQLGVEANGHIATSSGRRSKVVSSSSRCS